MLGIHFVHPSKGCNASLNKGSGWPSRGMEGRGMFLCPAHTPSCNLCSLEQHIWAWTQVQKSSKCVGGGTWWTPWPKSFLPCHSCWPSWNFCSWAISPKYLSFSWKHPGSTIALAWWRYLLRDGDAVFTTKNWTSTSYEGITRWLQSFMQRNPAWNGCVLPKVRDEGTSSDKLGLDEMTACICTCFTVCLT